MGGDFEVGGLGVDSFDAWLKVSLRATRSRKPHLGAPASGDAGAPRWVSSLALVVIRSRELRAALRLPAAWRRTSFQFVGPLRDSELVISLHE